MFCSLFLLVASFTPVVADTIPVGVVRGRVRLSLEGVRVAAQKPIIVFLDAVSGRLNFRTPAVIPRMTQHNAKFQPAYLIIAVGQSVDFPNDDRIFHNVFSFSKPNSFDLGVYPVGQSRRVTFRHAGVVRVYCSIHSSMNATIVVAPSPYFARIADDGSFEIRNVPPGRYTIRSWCERLPAIERIIALDREQGTTVDLAISP